ncbi:hypothetical protein [Nocardioides marmorisolisilvae]|uniref:Uncharacterized protein n=1 Tax=Nocardioides marmorisolisilvae TaxID=1542737 RepID=A0A3N0DSX8_9ACTN|nr:hypothetical protein [Nocardioides marmorisolisilvae]RNL78738.1 hypothetical protein EFL95_06575 [Nocardioides marmorisolisilvae]
MGAALIGFGAAMLWGAIAFAVGVRVGYIRASRRVLVLPPPRMPLGNTVQRMPEERAGSWEEPDWSRSTRTEDPGTDT